MAKQKPIVWVFLGIIALWYVSQSSGPMMTTTTTTGGGTDVDLCKVVDPTLSYTGQRMFKEGTSVGHPVRILRMGSLMDLGLTNDGGTQSVSPNAQYKLYFGENDTYADSNYYYTAVQAYTGPCQEAIDDVVGTMCLGDAAVGITVYNPDGQPQSAGSNDFAIGTDEVHTFRIKIKAAADKCFGNPDAPMGNAICFNHNTSTNSFTSVVADGMKKIPIPNPVSAGIQLPAGAIHECYEVPTVADTGETFVDVTLTATGNPTTAENVTVKLVDVAFDLDADTLEEIWGYEDEDLNFIGIGIVQNGTIQVT